MLKKKTSKLTTTIKTMWHWHKDRNTDQQSRTKSPEMKCHIVKLSFDQGVKTIQWERIHLGKLDMHKQKKDARPLSYTIYTY